MAWRTLTVASVVLLPFPTVAAAAPPVAADTLHVPYVAQSWLLCGGAAIAMVERWWGQRGVFAEEFADLVHPELGGIRTTDLVAATRARGWKADPFKGSATRVQAALRDSMPVVALIRVSPDRFHYVVVVSWHDGTVIFHDPAVGPYRSLGAAAFTARWAAADRWALLLTPGTIDTDATRPAANPVPTEPLPCPPWLDRAVDATRQGDYDRAQQQLDRARAACPSEPLIGRERAGIAFRRGEYPAAIALATAYLAQVPTDSLARKLLAASQYVAGDPDAALGSWNRIGRPTLDLLRIDGSRRIRFAALAQTIHLDLGRALTASDLALAGRRLADLPGVAASRIGYLPVGGDRVEVHAQVLEQPVVPPLPPLLFIGVARALASDETRLGVANLTGGGDRLTLEWRWRRANPGLALRFEAPLRLGIPVVIGVSGSRERFRFDDGTETTRRQRGGVDLHGWATPGLELLTGLALERWGHTRYATATLGGGLHSRHDRLALTGAVQHAFARGAAPDYRRAKADLAWRSTTTAARPTLTVRAGLVHATATTPRGLWPVAGGGTSQPIPLRSRPFLIHDLLPSDRTARTVIHGGLGFDHPIGMVGPVALGLGGFVDAAALVRPATAPTTSQWFLDAGIGLEVALPAVTAMRFRLDLAHGLHRSDRWGLSAGLVQPWPPRATGFR